MRTAKVCANKYRTTIFVVRFYIYNSQVLIWLDFS